MSDGFWIALGLFLGPMFMAFITNYISERRETKNWARQDKVAAAVKEVARVAAVNSLEVSGQLRTIHTLVNSNMTEALSKELAQTLSTATALKKVIELNREAGREPTPDDLEALAKTDERIGELTHVLADRAKQLEKAEHDDPSAFVNL